MQIATRIGQFLLGYSVLEIVIGLKHKLQTYLSCNQLCSLSST